MTGRGLSRWEHTRGCARLTRTRDDGQRGVAAVVGCSDNPPLHSQGDGHMLERRMWRGVQSHRRQEGGSRRVLGKRVDGSVQRQRKLVQWNREGIHSSWASAGEA